eukprot:6177111-Pleurochrysis_carterae.AAC.4
MSSQQQSAKKETLRGEQLLLGMLQVAKAEEHQTVRHEGGKHHWVGKSGASVPNLAFLRCPMTKEARRPEAWT